MYKTGREAIGARVEQLKKNLDELKIMLEVLPEELLDTEVDSVAESGNHLYLDVTDTEPRVVGRLMGAIHKLNKERYNSNETLWRKSWNPEIQIFEGIAVDEKSDSWFWINLRKKTGLGADCKRYRVRKTSEYETVVCGEPEFDEDVEILEVLE